MIDKNTFNIVLIGAGNLATNFGKALVARNFKVGQVYSRTEESAKELACKLDASYTTELCELVSDADLYIVSLTDLAFEKLLPEITKVSSTGLFVHTAGSVPMDIWKGFTERYGVFYPMQTFSKTREVDFASIPIFLETVHKADLYILKGIANELSNAVYMVSSEQRRSLHLSAVFACNFTNHMYALAESILEKNNIPFEVMLPLIDETALKVHQLSPRLAQTGPAVRYDENVIKKHLELLKDEPMMQEIYEKLSKSINSYS